MAGHRRKILFYGRFTSKAAALKKAHQIGGAVQLFNLGGRKVYFIVKKQMTREKNPLLLEYLNPPRAKVTGKIPGTLEEIRYARTGPHSGPYKHTFRTPATIYTLAGGGLLIRPRRRGDRLWVDLPD